MLPGWPVGGLTLVLPGWVVRGLTLVLPGWVVRGGICSMDFLQAIALPVMSDHILGYLHADEQVYAFNLCWALREHFIADFSCLFMYGTRHPPWHRSVAAPPVGRVD